MNNPAFYVALFILAVILAVIVAAATGGLGGFLVFLAVGAVGIGAKSYVNDRESSTAQNARKEISNIRNEQRERTREIAEKTKELATANRDDLKENMQRNNIARQTFSSAAVTKAVQNSNSKDKLGVEVIQLCKQQARKQGFTLNFEGRYLDARSKNDARHIGTALKQAFGLSKDYERAVGNEIRAGSLPTHIADMNDSKEKLIKCIADEIMVEANGLKKVDAATVTLNADQVREAAKRGIDRYKVEVLKHTGQA